MSKKFVLCTSIYAFDRNVFCSGSGFGSLAVAKLLAALLAKNLKRMSN